MSGRLLGFENATMPRSTAATRSEVAAGQERSVGCGAGSHFLEQPQEVRVAHQRHVESLRHQPDGVERSRRRPEEPRRDQQSTGGGQSLGGEGVRAAEHPGEQQDIQEQQAVEAADTHEGGGHQRIDERLAVVEPLVGGRDRALDADKRRARTDGDVDLSSPLEKNAVGSGSVDLPEAREVLSLESDVAVVREAQRHRYIRGLIALEPVRRLQHVERNRGRAARKMKKVRMTRKPGSSHLVRCGSPRS